MRIVILGGGTVGSSIAAFLCGKQDHQVTVVDSNPEVTERLDAELDVGVVTGSASLSNVLFLAGAGAADLCLALTGVDEVNLVAASLAKALGATHVAARVYANIFRDLSTFDYKDHFKIDRFLSIEHLTAMELARRIREPGSMMIEHFARGELEMQEVAIMLESNATGVPLKELKLPPEVRIGSISRDQTTRIATAEDAIIPGDRITILGAREKVEGVKKIFNTASSVKRSVVIAGGGETGFHLAELLVMRNYNVKILERNEERCTFLSDRLSGKATVINSDARRKLTLENEFIGSSNFFVAATGNDENNIMACVEAKKLGTETALAVINRPDYAGVVADLGIDVPISPREVMEGQIEGLLHTGPLVFANPHLLAGNINVVEMEVEGESPVTKAPLMECGLPKQSLLGAVVRNNCVQVPRADFQLKGGDSVIALVLESEIPALVKAFTGEKNGASS